MTSSTLSRSLSQRQQQRKPRPKPARSIRWLSSPLAAGRPFGVVRISVGKAVADYYLTELPAPDGRGFELEKITLGVPPADRDRYHVYYDANGQDSHCSCLGFLHHGHCKHRDGLAALLGR